MKIIIGSESFAPNISGVATAAELLARNLTEAGHKVWVFAPSRSRKSHIDKDYKDFCVVRLKSMVNPFRKGFRVTLLPGKEITTRVLEIKPDIIHLQDPTSICSGLLRVAKENGIKTVATNHFSLDYVVSYLKFLKPFHSQIKFILKLYLSGFYNQCDAVTCPTETVKKDLLTWGVKTEVTPISNGVDLDKFFVHSNLADLKRKYHLPPNPKVLYMGRVDKDKRIEVLISAIPYVLQLSDAHFIIAGMGDEVDKMKKLAQKLNIERQISWIGWIDKDSLDFQQIYQSASLFVIPSPIETQSIVTMEAMAAGLPVVGANAGALPELIGDGENGYLFEPDDSRDLADKISKILKNKSLAQKMRARSLEKIAAHEISKNFAEVLKIYEKLV